MNRLTDAIRTTYGYTAWANERILDVTERVRPAEFIAARPGGYGSIRDTLVHMFDTQRSWLERCQNLPDTPEPDPTGFADVGEIRAFWAEIEAATQTYLTGITDEDLAAHVTWQSTGGKTSSRARWELLLHQANHAAIHRGELAYTLTELGHSPGELEVMDFLRR